MSQVKLKSDHQQTLEDKKYFVSADSSMGKDKGVAIVVKQNDDGTREVVDQIQLKERSDGITNFFADLTLSQRLILSEYQKSLGRELTIEDLKEFAASKNNEEQIELVKKAYHQDLVDKMKCDPDYGKPKYSKAQIGQALANQVRANRAGRKLARKLKAQRIKTKGYK